MKLTAKQRLVAIACALSLFGVAASGVSDTYFATREDAHHAKIANLEILYEDRTRNLSYANVWQAVSSLTDVDYGQFPLPFARVWSRIQSSGQAAVYAYLAACDTGGETGIAVDETMSKEYDYFNFCHNDSQGDNEIAEEMNAALKGWPAPLQAAAGAHANRTAQHSYLEPGYFDHRRVNEIHKLDSQFSDALIAFENFKKNIREAVTRERGAEDRDRFANSFIKLVGYFLAVLGILVASAKDILDGPSARSNTTAEMAPDCNSSARLTADNLSD